jgi:hypothetical protein
MSVSITCPSCGHANTPGSRFCGRCGTQLDRIVGVRQSAQPAGAATLPPPPGGRVTITHRGNAHGVGYGENFYGVWSLGGGAPIQRFERTDAGWQMAWAYFQQLEAQSGEGKRKLFGRRS